MRRMLSALAVFLVAVAVSAQEKTSYAPSENPFQGEYALTLGKPLELNVEIAGVRLGSLTLTAPGEPEAGKSIKCQAELTGENTTADRVTLRAALLLETEDGNGLESISLDAFRVKSRRTFEERQTVRAEGGNLLVATKVYVFVELQR